MPRSVPHLDPSAGVFRRRAAAARATLALALVLSASAVAAAEVVTVAPVTVDDAKEVLATVESVRAPLARARIGGTLEKVAVVEGDRVAKDAVLAVVVDPKLKLQLQAADARIAALEAKLTLVQMELDRVRQLRTTGAAPQAKLDDSQTQLVVTKAEIAAAQAEKSVLEQQVVEGRVLAPDAGRVLKVVGVEGQVIMPGEPVASLATATYVLKLRLPERHARFIRQGDAIVVAGRGLDRTTDTRPVAGKIVRVYPELDQGRVVADAEAAGIGDFFVGERVRVLVSTGTRDTIVLPDAAVVRRAGLTFVRLAGRGEVPVQIGRVLPATGSEPARIEILTGLSAGDRVVTP